MVKRDRLHYFSDPTVKRDRLHYFSDPTAKRLRLPFTENRRNVACMQMVLSSNRGQN